MDVINLNVYSITDDEKPSDQYMTVVVFCEKFNFSDIGFYDGYSFKLWGRNSKVRHRDITHWSYIPQLTP